MSRQVPAYELADAIEEAMVDGFAFGYISEAVAMLRKLQAENDALKAKSLTDEEILDMSDSFCIDDEVSILYSFTASGLLNFIRAILRKAQEK